MSDSAPSQIVPSIDEPVLNKQNKLLILLVGLIVVFSCLGALGYALFAPEPGKPEIIYLQAQARFAQGKDFVVVNFAVDEALCQEKYGEQWRGCYDRRDQITVPSELPVLIPGVAGEWKYQDAPRLSYRMEGTFAANTSYSVSIPEDLLGENVVISPRTFTWKSQPLKATPRVQVQIDRADPRRSYVNATVTFNTWMDREAAESFIVLEAENGANLQLTDMRYDWQNDWTVVVSARVVELPAKDTYVFLRVKPGLSTKDGSDTLKSVAEARATVRSKNNVLTLNSLESSIVSKDLLRVQTLFAAFNLQMDPARLGGEIIAVLLPKYKDESKADEGQYYWDASEVNAEVLARSTPIELTSVPVGDDGISEVLAYSYKAEPGRQMLVTVPQGIRSPGGFPLSAVRSFVLFVPAYERELYIMQSGNILSLGGEKRLSIFTRGYERMQWEARRVRPDYINHLVTQNRGSFIQPHFGDAGYERNEYCEEEYFEPDYYGGYSTFDYYDISEVMRGSVALEPGDGSQPRFTSLDLSPHIGRGKTGIFHVVLTGMNGEEASGRSSRFILVTDLGVMLKENKNSERDLFVVSLSGGTPVAGARVEVLGRNGLPVLALTTDATGHAHVPSLEGLHNERQPVALVISSGADMTFMPLQGQPGALDLSRFPVGGREYSGEDIASFVFSERGIYRPGEELRFGLVTKRADWRAAEIAGMPVRISITDPGANEIFKEIRSLSAEGLESVSLALPESAQTGSYRLTASIASGRLEGTVLGSASVQVEEFKPDTLKIGASVSSTPVAGWLKPEEAMGRVQLDNLYGVAAVDHRVEARILLRPPVYSFSEFSGYTFNEPSVDIPDSVRNRTYPLGSVQTDEQGRAEFDLNLARFAGSGFIMTFEAEGFEAGGGRSVTGVAMARVSPREWLVGWKTDSTSSWLRKDAVSTINFIAVDRKLALADAGMVTFSVRAIDYVATLVRTDRGFKYDQSRREREIQSETLALTPDGIDYVLPTQNPGEYELLLISAEGETLCTYPFVVAGAGIAAFGRERDATLRLHINKQEFEAGEDIEIYLSAPYGGAGLITLESDRVLKHMWFNTELTDSVHRIRVPEDFEGRGFVSVSLVRGLDSKEIYMSPHTYAVAPFYANIARRDLGVSLSTPERVKPGEELRIGVSSRRAGRAIVFAVDEGILQLTSYRTPNPLNFFMRGQRLDVRTNQTFNLLMPEYSLVRESLAAFGGDFEASADMMMREMAEGQGMLNPFRRQVERSVVFWSGIVETGPDENVIGFTVPSYFNGRLRVMAVAVGADGVSSFSKSSIVRNDIIITPDLPVAAAPGDEFDVTISVANHIEGSGDDRLFGLKLDAGQRMAFVGDVPAQLPVKEGRDARAVVRLRALDDLGEGVLGISANAVGGTESASRPATISIRPATPRMSSFDTGRMTGNSFNYIIPRRIYEEYGTVMASVSALPVPVMDALSNYLLTYPYGCTEQILSAAFPYVLLHKNPDLLPLPQGISPVQAREDAEKAVARAVLALQERQVRSGAFSLWPRYAQSYSFLTVYAADFLSSAREAGFSVPQALEANCMNRLREFINHEPVSLEEARLMAYGAWVLTRNGHLTANSLAGLNRWLETKFARQWKQDVTAVYIAACNIMMKRQKEADVLIGAFTAQKGAFWENSWFDSPLSVNAQYLTIIARHFPERLADKATVNVLDAVVDAVMKNHYSSVSAAHAVRALAAYAENAVGARESFEMTALDAEGKAMQIEASGDAVRRMSLMGAASLRISGAKNLYWQVSINGFDRVPPAQPAYSGLELKTEYLDAQSGQPVQSVEQGDEVLVVLRARCNRGSVGNVALIAPLPGGFEQVISRAGQLQSPDERGDDGGTFDDAGLAGIEDDRSSLPDGESPTDREAVNAIAAMAKELGITTRPMAVTSTDRREDRMIVYTTLHKDETVFIYRIKAINRGSFTLPPAYAEALYERTLRANTAAARLVVE